MDEEFIACQAVVKISAILGIPVLKALFDARTWPCCWKGVFSPINLAKNFSFYGLDC